MRPLHPALVHFPVACWILAALLDAAALANASGRIGVADPSAVAALLVWCGLAFAACAVAAGLVDYARLPDAVRDSTELKRHMGWMGAASTLFLVAALLRAPHGPASAPVIASLEALGSLALVAGGHYASVVVFDRLPAVRTPDKASSDLVTVEEPES